MHALGWMRDMPTFSNLFNDTLKLSHLTCILHETACNLIHDVGISHDTQLEFAINLFKKKDITMSIAALKTKSDNIQQTCIERNMNTTSVLNNHKAVCAAIVFISCMEATRFLLSMFPHQLWPIPPQELPHLHFSTTQILESMQQFSR